MPEALALEPHRPPSIAFPLLAAILFLFFVSASVHARAGRLEPRRGGDLDHGRGDGSRRHRMDLIRGIDAVHGHPVIDRSFPLAELADAFRLQETGGHFGKIVVEF